MAQRCTLKPRVLMTAPVPSPLPVRFRETRSRSIGRLRQLREPDPARGPAARVYSEAEPPTNSRRYGKARSQKTIGKDGLPMVLHLRRGPLISRSTPLRLPVTPPKPVSTQRAVTPRP